MGDRVRKVKKLTRDRIKLDLDSSGDSEIMGRARDHTAGTSKDSKETKRKRPSKERWLLTRKTWRYMADAGRRLIPDGAHNRTEDIPKIEAYFQEVCQKETRFLLWRKSSYPGALGFRSNRKKRERKKGGSCREKASSADEAEEAKTAGAFSLQSTSGGRFDIQKMRQEFLKGATLVSSTGDQFQKHKFFKHVTDQRGHLPDLPEVPVAQAEEKSVEEEKEEVISTLLTLLDEEETTESKQRTQSIRSGQLDYEKLYEKLTRYLSTLSDATETSDELNYEPESRNTCEDMSPAEEFETSVRQDDAELHTENANISNQNVSSQWHGKGVHYEDDIIAIGESKREKRLDNDSKLSGTGTREGRGRDSSSNIGPLLLETRFSGKTRGIHRTLQVSENVHFDGDHIQRRLLETLRRYYSKSTNREKVISDLLTNRKVLEKLHFDLRQARGFKGRRVTSFTGSAASSQWKASDTQSSTQLKHVEEKNLPVPEEESDDEYDELQLGSWKRLGKPIPKRLRDITPLSPPPVIEIQPEPEPGHFDKSIQTEVIPPHVMAAIEEELRKERTKEENEDKEPKSPPLSTRRRSSVDHDDVSPSVSDTIKRYLRMARKKSLDSEKVDRFKRVNYDRNLRNIKPKGDKMGEDDGLNKGCQTEESWIAAIKELKLEDVTVTSDNEISPILDDLSGSLMTSSRSSVDGGTCDETLLSPPAQIYGKPSPGILSTGQTFLSNLLHGLQHNQPQIQQSNVGLQSCTPVSTAGATMQKSKSSSSVVHHGSRLVAKKIWRARSKSQSRATSSTTSTWTPQGNCTWSSVTGRQVILSDTNLLQLSEVERRVLQKVALAKLQALNLGCVVRIPSDSVATSVSHKPKRRAHLLKKKALTTSFFDNTRSKDGDKDKENVPGTGLVFGIPITQCLENDRLARGNRGGSPFRSRSDAEDSTELRRKAHHGSRSSFSSLIETGRAEESGSCESLMSPTERMAGSVPGLLDTLSYGSTVDISGLEEPSPSGVPQLVTTCFRHLEAQGLRTLGIFRVSGSRRRIRQLREEFDCGGRDTMVQDDITAHDAATLLKEYFRDLPEPLLCKDLYQPFIQTQRIRNRRLQYEALQHLIQLLPAANRDTLCSLLKFLARVAQFAEDSVDENGEVLAGNKMDSNNLATLFAPNILHNLKSGTNREVILDKELISDKATEERMDIINVIRTMIDHNQELFKISAELLDEVYVHMMDSHPEALDYLLNKRDTTTDELIIDDPESSATEGGGSECYSVPRTPTSLSGEFPPEPSETEEYMSKRIYTREEFLHERAATGGPNVSMRPRHKDRDRGRERGSKKRFREDGRLGVDLDGSDSSRLASNSSITGSLSSSQISSLIGRHRVERTISTTVTLSEDTAQKTRSASVDSGNMTSTTIASEPSEQLSTRVLKVADDDSNARRKSSPVIDGSNVITASLKIPVPGSNPTTFSLNLDDSDIPYIEDGTGYSVTADGRQQMMISLVRTAAGTTGTTTIRKTRQRTASGSDSSQTSTTVPQHDSALGSFNSPARNTTPSVCSSSGGEGGPFSSSPSWASTPPTSPDSTITTVDYIPEVQTARKTIGRTIQQQQKGVTLMTKEITPIVLQKVTFMSADQLKPQAQGESVHHISVSVENDESKTKSRLKSHLSPLVGDLPKSASTSSVTTNKKTVEFDENLQIKESQRKPVSSITSIGGAVMRSKTADIERMLRLQKSERLGSPLSKSRILPSLSKDVQEKKYTKRRYTDARHQTQHIPDSENLQSTSTSTVTQVESVASVRQSRSQQIQVYKRRELIASDPKDHETFL